MARRGEGAGAGYVEGGSAQLLAPGDAPSAHCAGRVVTFVVPAPSALSALRGADTARVSDAASSTKKTCGRKIMQFHNTNINAEAPPKNSSHACPT